MRGRQGSKWKAGCDLRSVNGAYSKIFLSRPFAGVNSCGPCFEVVALQSFAKRRKVAVILISVVRKVGRCREVVDLSRWSAWEVLLYNVLKRRLRRGVQSFIGGGTGMSIGKFNIIF